MLQFPTLQVANPPEPQYHLYNHVEMYSQIYVAFHVLYTRCIFFTTFKGNFSFTFILYGP
ncbi:hypothetical protein BDZ91DRAFT_710154 [Kalaharituber pfeilii]|nr:hypothetical protein BDZ91DRAFT_710154 [Kalaharituber pfeilii]